MNASAPNPSRLGAAATDRWRLSRAGIVNVYQYGDEVLHFAGGRLLLRGVNGSGKSTAMNMLLPFLLTTREGRIDAAGEQSGILKSWMLKGRDDAQPVGYLWIEFERRGEFLVCGCGIKANRQSDSVNTWWFVTSKRPGVDLDLVSGGVALSSEALRAAINGDEVFSRARRRDYRRAIEQRLFSGAEIDQHIRLINKVRSPRVGDRIDLELRDYLVDALPQVSDQALTAAAQPLDELEGYRRSVADLGRTLGAVRGLLDVYRSYCLSDLRRRSDEGRDCLSDRRGLGRDEQKARRAAEEARIGLKRLDTAIDGLTGNQRRLRREIEALEKSQAYQQGQQLDGLRQHVLDLARQCEKSTARVGATEGRVARDAQDVDRAQRTGRSDRDALNAALADADELGRRCGLDRRPPGPISLAETILADSDCSEPAPVDIAPVEQQLDAAAAAVTRRRAAAEDLEHAIEAEQAAERLLAQAEAEREHANRSAAGAAARLSESTERLGAARSDWIEELQLWASAAHRLFGSAGLDAPLAAAWAQGRAGGEDAATAGPGPLLDSLRTEAEALVDHWLSAAGAAESRLASEREAEQQAQELVDELADRDEPEAPRLHWQHDADYCLADLVDFAPGLDDSQRAGLEAALQSSGLLSARPADGAVELEGGELVAVASHGVASPLSDLLTVTVPRRLEGAVDEGSIRKLLESVTHDPSSDEATLATLDGAFRVGSLRGRHRKDHAEHIGATARRAALRKARAEAQSRLEEARAAVRRSLAELDGHRESQRTAQRQRASLPATAAILSAQAVVDAAVTALEEAVARRDEAVGAAAEAERALSGASDALHRMATSLSMPRDSHGLNAFTRDLAEAETALRQCGSQAQALSRSVKEWKRACDRWRVAAEALDDSRAELRRLERRHAEEHATLVTIEDSIGAEYAEVVAARDRCRAELDDLDISEAGLGRERDVAIRREAESEAAVDAAAERRKQAEEACEAARISLDEALTTPGYLAAILSGDAHPDSTAGDADASGEAAATDAPGADTTAHAPAAIAAGAAGSEGLSDMLDALGPLLPADVAEMQPDSVRQSLLQRRDALGAGWDAEARQPYPQKPLFVEVTGPSGTAALAESVRAVAQDHQRVAGLLNSRQDAALRELLQGMIAREIAEKIFGAERLVGLMNQRLGEVATAHRVGVRLRWRRSRELDEPTGRLVELLAKKPDLRNPDEDLELRQVLSGRLDEARAEQPELPYRQLIAEALDYKQWHEMAVMVRRGGHESRLSRSTPLSEGEKKLITYLPLFAAVSASYDALAEQQAETGDEQPGIARFVLLDDAFAKVSEDNHAALFGLVVDLNLDFIATSERLWGTHATVPELAVTEVIRDATLSTIMLEHYRWDGTTLRREDGP